MYFLTIDIAHPPLSTEAAEEVLDDELNKIRSSEKLRVLKVIHGHGTSERPAVLKQVVLNWAHRNRTRLRAVISGEDYNILDAKTQEMRKQCGQVQDPDIGKSNPGMTLIWIK
jgi:Smr domain